MIIFRRLYHVSCTAYSYKKLGLKLCKMINPKNKRQWHPSELGDAASLPSLKSLTKVEREPGKRGTRRVAMLNKIFMKQITDLMSTGTVAMDILGRGIEISKVRVTRDFQTVNVFWVCKGNASDEQTETVLNKTAGALRHELSTLRVMGEVPYVVFVKDKQEAHLVDLDRRLAIADYGENFNPTEIGHLLKTEFTLDTKLSPEMKAKIKQLEDNLQLQEEPIPEMTNNIYGLDHARIMNRLLAARKKTRDAWVNLDSPVISYRATGVAPQVDVGNQRKELADFLLKRQILQSTLRKQQRASRHELLALGDSYEDEDDIDPPYYGDEDGDEYFDDEDDDFSTEEPFEDEGLDTKPRPTI